MNHTLSRQRYASTMAKYSISASGPSKSITAPASVGPGGGANAVQQQQAAGDLQHLGRVDQVIDVGHAQAVDSERQAAVDDAQHNQRALELARQIEAQSRDSGCTGRTPKTAPSGGRSCPTNAPPATGTQRHPEWWRP